MPSVCCLLLLFLFIYFFSFTVEKEELVNLVLIHANSIADSNSNRSSSQFSEDNFSNPFDQIKQTCQNLFTSFTDKIASGERYTKLIFFLYFLDDSQNISLLLLTFSHDGVGFSIMHYLLLRKYYTLSIT